MTDFFDIGVIVKPQGVKGELRVFPVTDEPARFTLLDAVYIALRGGEPAVYAVENARAHGNMVLLKLAGIDDRNAAAALVNGVIKIPPEQALPLEENEYYVRDLLGIDVYTEDGGALGALTEVLRTGANDVYSVRTADGRDVLLPAIKQCVLSTDINARKMTVRVPEGLM